MNDGQFVERGTLDLWDDTMREQCDRIEQLEKELSTCRMAQVVMDNTVAKLTAERDEAWAYMSAVQGDLYDAITIEAERDRLREVLIELIQHTHNCERQLTEDLHHVDFCGESVPLTNAREALKGDTL